MPSRDSNSSSHRRRRRDRRPRRSNDADADSERKRQLKAERRAQIMENANNQDMSGHTESESSGAVGDTLEPGNVTSSPRSSRRGGSSRSSSRRSGGSSRRNGGSRSSSRRNNRSSRPAKRDSKAASSQVGAVATTGRAFGAPRRPPSAPDNTTRSIVGDGNFAFNDEEEQSMQTKEAFAMNAMTVEDHEREKRRQKKVQKEASRLTREIRDSNDNKRNKRKPYQKELAFTIAEEEMEKDMSNERKNDAEAAVRRWKMIAIGLTVVVIVGCGVVAFFLTRPSSTISPVVNNQTTTAPTFMDPSVPTVINSESPSTSPSMGNKYDPPGDDDCARIKSGLSVAGQEDMEKSAFRMSFEVQLRDPNLPIDSWLPAFTEGIDNVLIPVLVGCPISERRLSSKASLDLDVEFTRDLQGVDSYLRYAIANAVSSIGPVRDLSDCGSEKAGCKNVPVVLELFLKGEERGYAIIGLIVEIRDKLLARMFGFDPNNFESVTLESIDSMDPTTSPSTAPTPLPTIRSSLNPTLAPSSSPTIAPTSNPTPTPTPGPTPGPTLPPTPGPTPQPTPQPTPGPTPNPTPGPTPNPTPPPTSSPTPGPTPSPTPFPTQPPTPGPTPAPTRPNPTSDPSTVPSILPSILPSRAAVTTPS